MSRRAEVAAAFEKASEFMPPEVEMTGYWRRVPFGVDRFVVVFDNLVDLDWKDRRVQRLMDQIKAAKPLVEINMATHAGVEFEGWYGIPGFRWTAADMAESKFYPVDRFNWSYLQAAARGVLYLVICFVAGVVFGFVRACNYEPEQWCREVPAIDSQTGERIGTASVGNDCPTPISPDGESA